MTKKTIDGSLWKLLKLSSSMVVEVFQTPGKYVEVLRAVVESLAWFGKDWVWVPASDCRRRRRRCECRLPVRRRRCRRLVCVCACACVRTCVSSLLTSTPCVAAAMQASCVCVCVCVCARACVHVQCLIGNSLSSTSTTCRWSIRRQRRYHYNNIVNSLTKPAYCGRSH